MSKTRRTRRREPDWAPDPRRGPQRRKGWLGTFLNRYTIPNDPFANNWYGNFSGWVQPPFRVTSMRVFVSPPSPDPAMMLYLQLTSAPTVFVQRGDEVIASCAISSVGYQYVRVDRDVYGSSPVMFRPYLVLVSSPAVSVSDVQVAVNFFHTQHLSEPYDRIQRRRPINVHIIQRIVTLDPVAFTYLDIPLPDGDLLLYEVTFYSLVQPSLWPAVAYYVDSSPGYDPAKFSWGPYLQPAPIVVEPSNPYWVVMSQPHVHRPWLWLSPGPKYLHLCLDLAYSPGYSLQFQFVFHEHKQRSRFMDPITDTTRRRRYAEEAFPA